MFVVRKFKGSKKTVPVNPAPLITEPSVFYIDLLHDGVIVQGGCSKGFFQTNTKKLKPVPTPVYYRFIKAIHKQRLSENPAAYFTDEFNDFNIENDQIVHMQTINLGNVGSTAHQKVFSSTGLIICGNNCSSLVEMLKFAQTDNYYQNIVLIIPPELSIDGNLEILMQDIQGLDKKISIWRKDEMMDFIFEECLNIFKLLVNSSNHFIHLKNPYTKI